jgi:hypothetical protein
MTLLEEVRASLAAHAARTGETIDRFFTRQVHERVRGQRLPAKQTVPGWPNIRLVDGLVVVHAEQWPLEALDFKPPWHLHVVSSSHHQSPVVFRGWGYKCLVDGQSRVNIWNQSRQLGPYRMLVVEPRKALANPFPSA